MAKQDTYFQDLFENSRDPAREEFDALVSTRKRQAPEGLVQPFDRERASREPAYLPAGAIRPPQTTFANAFEAGVRGMSANRKYFGALFRDARGERATADALIKQGQEQQQLASLALSGEPTFKQFLNEPTVGGFLRQAVLATGQFAPSAIATISTALATGGTFALARMTVGQAALRLGMKKAAKDIATKKMKGQALSKAERNFLQDYWDVVRGKFVKKGGEVVYNPGFIGGAGLQEYTQGTGIAYSDFAAQGMRDPNAQWRARSIGLGYAAIGVLGEAAVFTSFKRLATSKAARLGKKGQISYWDKTLKRQLARDVLFKAGLVSAISEGGAEGLQEELSIQQKFNIDPDYTKAEAKLDRLQAYFYGAVGGFGLGAAGGSAASISRIARTQFVNAAEGAELFKGLSEDEQENIKAKQEAGKIEEDYVMAIADQEGEIVGGQPHDGTPEGMEAAEAYLREQNPDIGQPGAAYKFYQDRAGARNPDGTLKPLSTVEYVDTVKKQQGITDEHIDSFLDEIREETGETKLPLDELGNPITLSLIPESLSFKTEVVTQLGKSRREGWATDKEDNYSATANLNIETDRVAFNDNMRKRSTKFTEQDLETMTDRLQQGILEANSLLLELESPSETMGEFFDRSIEAAKRGEKILSLISEKDIGKPKEEILSRINEETELDLDSTFANPYAAQSENEMTDRNRPITEVDLIAVNANLKEGAKPYGAKDERITFGDELIGQPLYTLFSDALMKRVERLAKEEPGSIFTIDLETDEDQTNYGRFKIYRTATIDELRVTSTAAKIKVGLEEAINSEKRKRWGRGQAIPGYDKKGGSGWFLVPRKGEDGKYLETVNAAHVTSYEKNGRIPIDMAKLTIRGTQINRLSGNLLDNSEKSDSVRWVTHMADGFFTAFVELDRLGYDIDAAIHTYEYSDKGKRTIIGTEFAPITDPSFYRIKDTKAFKNQVGKLFIYESAAKETKQWKLEQDFARWLEIEPKFGKPWDEAEALERQQMNRQLREAKDVVEEAFGQAPIKAVQVKDLVKYYRPDFALHEKLKFIRWRQAALKRSVETIGALPAKEASVLFRTTEEEKAAGDTSYANKKPYTPELIKKDLFNQVKLQNEITKRKEERYLKGLAIEEIGEALTERREYLYSDEADFETVSLEAEQELEQRVLEDDDRGEWDRNKLVRDMGGQGLTSSERINAILQDYRSLKASVEREKQQELKRKAREVAKKEKELEQNIGETRRENEVLHRKLLKEAMAEKKEEQLEDIKARLDEQEQRYPTEEELIKETQAENEDVYQTAAEEYRKAIDEEMRELRLEEAPLPPTEVQLYPKAFQRLIKKFDQFAKAIRENKLTKKTAGREVLWFGEVDYTYANVRHLSQPMPEEFSDLAREIEFKLKYPKGYFNSVLSNLYPKGRKIGTHSDDEKIFIKENKTIGAVATISLGGDAQITIINRETKDEENMFFAREGSLYVMPDGTFQFDKMHKVGEAKGPRISMTFRHIPETQQPAPSGTFDIKTAVLHSGGAIGADRAFAEIGKEFGLLDENNRHYSVGKKYTPVGVNKILTQQEAKEADAHLLKANETLGRTFPTSKPYVNNLLRRNWWQVKNSDAVFAVSTLDPRVPGTAKGGTGWAVQMGIDEGKPVYVFDQSYKQWFQWYDEARNFIEIETPILTPNFAGVGARNLTPAGREAIRQLYQKAGGQKVIVKTVQEASKVLAPPPPPPKEALTPAAPTTEAPINVYYGRGENKALSNFVVRPFEYEGRSYRSVEHAYQTNKSGLFDENTYLNPAWRKVDPRKAVSPRLRDQSKSEEVMKKAMKASFEQNPGALKLLLATGERKLTHVPEKGHWGEAFPRLLMEVRNELKVTDEPVPGIDMPPTPPMPDEAPLYDTALKDETMVTPASEKRKAQELFRNTFFSPSVQKYFRKAPFSMPSQVSGPSIAEKMARLARTAFKIDADKEIVVIDQRENLANNPKINPEERTRVEEIRKRWVEKTTKKGNVVHIGNKHIIMLRASAKPSPTEYISNVFVFGHELGHILFKQEWARLSIAQQQRMFQAWDKAKQQPNAPKQWSTENGIEEWAADRMSRYLFDASLKAETAADTIFKKFARLLRTAFKQLHAAFQVRFGQQEAVGHETFEEWANGVVQSYRDGSREAVRRGEVTAEQEYEIQNMIDETLKNMPPSDKKKYSELMSILAKHLKRGSKNLPVLIKAIFKDVDNFIGGLGKDKQSEKNFKRHFPIDHENEWTATKLIQKMLYGASQSLDKVGYSNVVQRKKRIYSKDKLGKFTSLDTKTRVGFQLEAEGPNSTYVMEDVPSDPTLEYMQQHDETVFIIDNDRAISLGLNLNTEKKLENKWLIEQEGPKPSTLGITREHLIFNEYTHRNIIVLPPVKWRSKGGVMDVWFTNVERVAKRRSYTTALSLPAAVSKRLYRRVKIAKQVPVIDPNKRAIVLKLVDNPELLEHIQDTENPTFNGTYVPNIGVGEGQLSEGAFGMRYLYRYMYGAERLSDFGVALANDFMARMLNIVELGESSQLREKLVELIVKFNKRRTHYRLIQSPYPGVSNEQLYEAYKGGKEKITIKNKETNYKPKTIKIQKDLGNITGYFEKQARNKKGEIIWREIRHMKGNELIRTEKVPVVQYWEKFEVNKELAEKIVRDVVMQPDQAAIDLALSEEEYFNDSGLADSRDAQDFAIGLLPHRSKIFSFIPTVEMRKAGVLVDPDITVDRYVANTIKKIEWEKRGGWKRVSALLDTISDPFERRILRTAIKNTLGKYDADMSSAFRAINSWGLFLNISTLLAFAVFASFPDLAGPVLRSKEFRALKTAGRTLFEMYQNPQDAARLAEEIGVATREALDNMYIHSVDADWMLDTPRAWSDKFFKWTFTEGYTRFMRQFASSMGKQFLVYHAEQARLGNKRSIRYLAELDRLSWDEVKLWEKAGYSFSGRNGRRVRDALGRFVEESVIRPNASERPFWASDPRYALIWQLKAFFYAYGKVIVGGVAREALSRRKETGNVTAMLPPFMLLATTVLPLTMLGWDLRERAKYGLAVGLPFIEPSPSRLNDMDWGPYLFEVFDRSGVFGPYTILAQMRQNYLWQESALTPILGPMAEKFEDMIRLGGGYNLTNLLPLYSQLPKRRY